MKIHYLIIICIVFIFSLFNNDACQNDNKPKNELVENLIGTWISDSMIRKIKDNNSIFLAYEKYSIEDGFPLFNFEIQNDILVRGISDFNDYGYDAVKIENNKFVIDYKSYAEEISIISNTEILCNLNKKNISYTKISNNSQNLDSIINNIFMNILFNNTEYIDSSNAEFKFESNKLINDKLDTIKCFIEFNPVTIDMNESDIIYFGDKSKIVKFKLMDDKLILHFDDRIITWQKKHVFKR